MREMKKRSGLVYDPTQDCKLVGAMSALGGVKDAITVLHARMGCHCGVLLLKAIGSNQNDTFKPALIAVLSCSEEKERIS